MNYDTTGIELTEDSEALRLIAYPDPATLADPWTIGYGHTGDDVYEGLVITEDRAVELLHQDIHFAEDAVKRLVTVELTQGQYDALVDFTFNVGVKNLEKSTLLYLVNAGKMAEADEQFERWVHAGGHILKGLVTRRYKEARIFNA